MEKQTMNEQKTVAAPNYQLRELVHRITTAKDLDTLAGNLGDVAALPLGTEALQAILPYVPKFAGGGAQIGEYVQLVSWDERGRFLVAIAGIGREKGVFQVVNRSELFDLIVSKDA